MTLVPLERGSIRTVNGVAAWVLDNGTVLGADSQPAGVNPPRNLTAAGAVGKVLLGWDASTTAGISGYRVWASTVEDFTPDASTLLGTTTATEWTHSTSDTSLWFYAVAAYTSSAESPYVRTQAAPEAATSTGDWRAHPLLRPPAGKVVAGMSATGSSSGSIGEIAAQWGASYHMTRVYGGTMSTLSPISGTAQRHLDDGVVPVIDLNLSKQLADCGIDFSNPMGSGKTVWRWIADGGMDDDFTPAGGKRILGLRSQITALLNLRAGACPTSRFIISTCHEAEDMNEGGGDHRNGTRSGSDADYAAHMRHVVQLARSMGLTRNRALWLLDGAAGVSHWGEDMTDTGSSGFYPGHSFCDVVGWDPYNAYPYRVGTPHPFSYVVNKFGQLDWWNRNFTVGGADTAAQASAGQGVYKPVLLAEYGTGDYDGVQPWFDDHNAYLADNWRKFRWVLYFNNFNNDVLKGQYRPGAHRGRGKHAVWAAIS